ncbi:unnamed protein product [Cercospora beticola]|nr:unnamed protein product [Cercospora beticola]
MYCIISACAFTDVDRWGFSSGGNSEEDLWLYATKRVPKWPRVVSSRALLGSVKMLQRRSRDLDSTSVAFTIVERGKPQTRPRLEHRGVAASRSSSDDFCGGEVDAAKRL